MADLIRWTPLRVLLRRRDPYTELREMQRDMDRLFGQFFGRDLSVPEAAGEWTPLVETYMKGDNLILRCELPGVDPKDVDVSFDERSNQLVIKGERKQDKETKDEDYM